MKNIFTLFFLSFILFSCSRDNQDEVIEDDEPLITKMSLILYPNSFPYNNAELSYIFQYDNEKRLIKKIGGFLQSSWGTGYEGFGLYFTDKIYTSLIYNNNSVVVEDFSFSSDFNVLKNSKFFIIQNDQIQQKEIPSANNSYLDKKLAYKYVNNQISEIKTILPNMPYDPTDPYDYKESYIENFFYDSKGNLLKTEYILQNNGINTKEKTVRIFEDYDNSSNPWKRLRLLDEFFYRSISKNNFRKYREIKYDFAGNIISHKEQTWTFNYDTNGNIIIN